jgi:hypothetical protein
VHLEKDSYVFLLTIHHIIADGWSMEVLVYELATLYNSFVSRNSNHLPPLRVQYKDYVAWQKQNEQTHSDSRRYWLSQFDGELPALQLPVDFPKPQVETYEGSARNYTLNVSNDIREACRKTDTTLFMFLLSTVNVLLYRHTGQKDILVGSPTAGRTHRDLEEQIGLFVNMLVFRTRFEPDTKFEELLLQVKNNALNAYAHQSYPFMQLVKDIQKVQGFDYSHVFNVAVQLQNAKLQKTKNVQFQDIRITNFLPNAYSSKFDITFNFEDLGEVITLDIEYKTKLFKESTIDKMAYDLMFLLESCATDISLTLKHLKNSLIQKTEQKQLNQLAALMEKGISAEY